MEALRYVGTTCYASHLLEYHQVPKMVESVLERSYSTYRTKEIVNYVSTLAYFRLTAMLPIMGSYTILISLDVIYTPLKILR